MNLPSVVARVARFGLADVLDVRRELSAAGLDRQGQDNAINVARRAGLVSGCAREGRTRPTAEQLAADLPDGIGHLFLREG